ncbi:hypothetical protein [Ascidiimonas sp. W6]|uniref:hypothetical protein n=1 Tax=Ascidiimonas meishanensis TaxID=3128903 RepID=UPI0030EDFB90
MDIPNSIMEVTLKISALEVGSSVGIMYLASFDLAHKCHLTRIELLMRWHIVK